MPKSLVFVNPKKAPQNGTKENIIVQKTSPHMATLMEK